MKRNTTERKRAEDTKNINTPDFLFNCLFTLGLWNQETEIRRVFSNCYAICNEIHFLTNNKSDYKYSSSLTWLWSILSEAFLLEEEQILISRFRLSERFFDKPIVHENSSRNHGFQLQSNVQVM